VVSGLAGDVAVKFANTRLSGLVRASIPLYQGWNLVALPLVLADSSPAAIFAPIAGRYSAVFTYNACDSADPWSKFDPNAPSFVNDLTAISTGQGLWIRVNADTTVTITGTVPGNINVSLCAGANLIGYPSIAPVPLPDALVSIAGKYQKVYAYDPADDADPWKAFDPSAPPFANDLGTLGPGRGYWVQMTEPANLGLNNQ
jgi:hypothetical protein